MRRYFNQLLKRGAFSKGKKKMRAKQVSRRNPAQAVSVGNGGAGEQAKFLPQGRNGAQRTLRRRGADAHGGVPGRPEAGRVTAFCLPASRKAASRRCAPLFQSAFETRSVFKRQKEDAGKAGFPPKPGASGFGGKRRSRGAGEVFAARQKRSAADFATTRCRCPRRRSWPS